MSTFKYTQGKLIEQPTITKPNGNYGWTPDAWLAANKQYDEHIASLRSFIAEGFSAEDEGKMFDEKDFQLQHQELMVYVTPHYWRDCDYKRYEIIQPEYRRIIARKLNRVSEEGKNPDAMVITVERMAETILKQNQEIDRLKGLIEKAHYHGYHADGTRDESWKDFIESTNIQ